MTASSSRLAACHKMPTFQIFLSSAALAGDASETRCNASAMTNPNKGLRIAMLHTFKRSVVVYHNGAGVRRPYPFTSCFSDAVAGFVPLAPTTRT